jgi:predicted RNA-binding protein YlxR (DUF448 family)/ribosomal protein L7Ae-like RNA K-turn-binding protein
MVRLVLAPSGEIAVDAAGGGFGRGAHVHARGACLQKAATRGLLRATKGKASSVSVAVKEGADVLMTDAHPIDVAALAQAIEAAMARRIAGLLGTSARTRKARVGSDAATSAWRSGEASLLVVATDAAAAADLGAVREAVDAGAAVAWGTKQSLAAALQRPQKAEGVAVVAITDTRIAAAVRDAVEKTMGARSDEGTRRAPRGVDKDAATPADFRGKVGAERAGRFGRQRRRATSSSSSLSGAQGKQAVERSE